MKLPMAPELLLELVAKNKIENKDKGNTKKGTDTKKQSIKEFDDSLSNQKRFITFLQQASPAIQGNGGDEQTYRYACKGRDFGLPLDTNFRLMLNHYNTQCKPCWSTRELLQKVENAYKYAKSPLGSENPQADFKDLDIVDTRNANLSTITAKELDETLIPPQNWCIKPILSEGLTLLAGAPKMGKSFLAYSLGCAISSETLALGSYATSQGEVLYLALEDGPRRLQDRLRKLSTDNKKLISDNLFLCMDIPRYDEGGREFLIEWLEKHPNCKLVIIDTLIRFSPPSKRHQNAYENDYAIMGALQKLAIERSITILAVTHLRKESSNDPLARIMGSTGMTGAADSIWMLSRQRGQNNGELFITGRDVNEINIALELVPSSCQWIAKGNVVMANISPERRAILQVLEEMEIPVKVDVVANSLGKDKHSVVNLLRNMVEDGQVQQPARGLYASFNDDFDDL